jgi:hypothetical protein
MFNLKNKISYVKKEEEEKRTGPTAFIHSFLHFWWLGQSCVWKGNGFNSWLGHLGACTVKTTVNFSV